MNKYLNITKITTNHQRKPIKRTQKNKGKIKGGSKAPEKHYSDYTCTIMKII